MRKFKQEKMVSNCGECGSFAIDRLGDCVCMACDCDIDRETYNQNCDGITPSCPMYPQSVEVEG
jgi:hypothetical protein